MPRNLEIKARIATSARAIETARHLGAREEGQLRQTDTYFLCRHGRLKLREIEGERSELIAYVRPEETPQRVSSYELVPVDQPELLREILSRSLGVRAVVKKVRTLYLYGGNRIHIDEVAGLGDFIEFEVPLVSREDSGHRAMNDLMNAFGICDGDCFRGSYVDLLTGVDLS
jgi:predicted adenylyl cyclase CyaB